METLGQVDSKMQKMCKVMTVEEYTKKSNMATPVRRNSDISSIDVENTKSLADYFRKQMNKKNMK